jgi:hypothetical protein
MFIVQKFRVQRFRVQRFRGSEVQRFRGSDFYDLPALGGHIQARKCIDSQRNIMILEDLN